MHWTFTHTVVMRCSLQQAVDICINLDNFIPMQELASKNVKVYQRGDESKIPPIKATKETILEMLESKDLPDLPWSSLDKKEEEPHALYFDMVESGIAKVAGSQFSVKDLNVVIFHSSAKLAGIEEWKLRLAYEDGGVVKVSERVWGAAPAIVVVPLQTFDIPRKVLAKHMDSYHTLLPTEASPA